MEIKEFNNKFNDSKSTVFYKILGIVKNKELTEDIWHDTYIKAFSRIESKKYDDKHFIAWIYRIAYNLTMDAMRLKKRTRNFIKLEKFLATTPDHHGNVDTFDMPNEEFYRNIRLYSAIKQLEPEQQEIIKQRYFYGYSFKEITELSGNKVSINTSLGRARYALINLRKILKKE